MVPRTLLNCVKEINVHSYGSQCWNCALITEWREYVSPGHHEQVWPRPWSGPTVSPCPLYLSLLAPLTVSLSSAYVFQSDREDHERLLFKILGSAEFILPCKCECEANVDVTNSQRIIRSSSTLFNSLANIAAKGRLWRQIPVKFASHSHSQEVWTWLKSLQRTREGDLVFLVN